jgi:hypothetical protein
VVTEDALVAEEADEEMTAEVEEIAVVDLAAETVEKVKMEAAETVAVKKDIK